MLTSSPRHPDRPPARHLRDLRLRVRGHQPADHEHRSLGMPPAQAGVAAAVASTTRQVGSTLGVAVLGALAGASASGALGRGSRPGHPRGLVDHRRADADRARPSRSSPPLRGPPTRPAAPPSASARIGRPRRPADAPPAPSPARAGHPLTGAGSAAPPAASVCAGP